MSENAENKKTITTSTENFMISFLRENIIRTKHNMYYGDQKCMKNSRKITTEKNNFQPLSSQH